MQNIYLCMGADVFEGHRYICNCCGADLFDGKGFCGECLKILPFNSGKICKLCGSQLLSDADYCANCKPKLTFFDRAFSSFDYRGDIVSLIYGLKYGGKKYLANVFATYLYVSFLSAAIEVDFVVAVPLSQKSLLERGYNQSELLAQEFCKLSKISLLTDCLEKTKDTSQQEKLNNRERRLSLLGAFRVLDKKAFEGKNILVIDDVKTTGTTLNRVAKEIKKCRAKRVYGLTVASTREKFRSTQENKR